jgi:hypothetical protein
MPFRPVKVQLLMAFILSGSARNPSHDEWISFGIEIILHQLRQEVLVQHDVGYADAFDSHRRRPICMKGIGFITDYKTGVPMKAHSKWRSRMCCSQISLYFIISWC